MLRYTKIKGERTMRACTGLDFDRLDKLTKLFEMYYKKHTGECYFEMIKRFKMSDNIIFTEYKDIVFFILYSNKVANTFDVIGATRYERSQRTS